MMLRSNEAAAIFDKSGGRLLPALQAPEHLDVYDIRGATYAIQLSVTTMTGLINRPQPRVYLISNDDAAFWLNEVLAHIPHDISPSRGEAVLDTLLARYGESVQGLINYDPGIIDSVNIATMLAGLRDGIVVSPQQAEILPKSGYNLAVLEDLRLHRWKNRLQVYRWAWQHLLKECAAQPVAGLDPRIAGGLRSFLVATRTFIYWLDSRLFVPDPRNGWMSERCLMKHILEEFAPGTPHAGWFIDEYSGVSLASKAAMPVFASDYFSNLEVWTSTGDVQAERHPRTAFSRQAGQPETTGTGSTGVRPQDTSLPGQSGEPEAYISFTFSEGDNLQYDQNRMRQLWQDPARGSLPIGWTISPLLLQAAPAMTAYYMRTASPNDELIAGPSGAGYIFPSRWPRKYLPAFLALTGESMQAMRLAVLQVLDANLLSNLALTNEDVQEQCAKTLASFGVRGILSGAGRRRSGWRSFDGIPVVQNLGVASSVGKTLRLIRNATARGPRFLNVYVLAWSMTPSDLKKVVQELGSAYKVVTPGKLLVMIAKQGREGGGPAGAN